MVLVAPKSRSTRSSTSCARSFMKKPHPPGPPPHRRVHQPRVPVPKVVPRPRLAKSGMLDLRARRPDRLRAVKLTHELEAIDLQFVSRKRARRTKEIYRTICLNQVAHPAGL